MICERGNQVYPETLVSVQCPWINICWSTRHALFLENTGHILATEMFLALSSLSHQLHTAHLHITQEQYLWTKACQGFDPARCASCRCPHSTVHNDVFIIRHWRRSPLPLRHFLSLACGCSLFVSSGTERVNRLLASLDVMKMTRTHRQISRDTHIMRHVWWGVILSVWVTRTTLISVTHIWHFRNSAQGTEKEGMHLPSCFLLKWMTPSEFGRSAFVCASVCARISGSAIEQSDRLRPPLGLRHLSVQHTLSFLHAIHLAHTKAWTHTQLNDMSRCSVEFICNLLKSALFSNPDDRNLITLKPSLHTSHHRRTPLHYFCLSITLPPLSPVFCAFL